MNQTYLERIKNLGNYTYLDTENDFYTEIFLKNLREKK